MALEHEKIKHLTDVPALIDFFFTEVRYDPASVEKVLKKPDVIEILREAVKAFDGLTGFTAASTEAAAKDVAAKRGVKNAAVYHPVRVSVSGRTQGPSLFHMLEVLGRDRSLQRMHQTIERLSTGTL